MSLLDRQRLCAALLIGGTICNAFAEESPRFDDGERVVLVGNTVIERAQQYGHVEFALSTRGTGKNVTFRNLGWSGDTVFGEARAGFDTPKEGRARLIEQVQAAKPTTLVIGYGSNAAFDGAEGLPRFVAGLNELLDAWTDLGAKTVLLGPLDHEDLGRPLPDPASFNENVALVREAIRGVAEERGIRYVDAQARLGSMEIAEPLTDNGVHLNESGYRQFAQAVANGLLGSDPGWRLDINQAGLTEESSGFDLEGIDGYEQRMEIRFVDACGAGRARRWLRVRDLPYERYTLVCNGRDLETASAEQWAEGVEFDDAEAAAAGESLRQAIIEKNRLFFFRWRPQNETYLFGFRKHEQGQNAVEVPQFDEHVSQAEAAIEEMRKPIQRVYTLRRTK